MGCRLDHDHRRRDAHAFDATLEIVKANTAGTVATTGTYTVSGTPADGATWKLTLVGIDVEVPVDHTTALDAITRALRDGINGTHPGLDDFHATGTGRH